MAQILAHEGSHAVDAQEFAGMASLFGYNVAWHNFVLTVEMSEERAYRTTFMYGKYFNMRVRPIHVIEVVCVLSILSFFAMATEITADDRPSVVSAVAPSYPTLARVARQGGEVTVRVSVDVSGNVVSCEMTEGNKIFKSSSEIAARKWRFAVAERAESAAPTHIDLKFVYRLMPEGTVKDELTAIFLPPYTIEVRGLPGEIVQLSEPPRIFKKH